MTPNNILGILSTVIISYLLGSINFAVILSRSQHNDDVRNYGSGNAGMTNMLRTYGKWLATLTALGDFTKGLIAILISRYVIFPYFNVEFMDAGYIAGLFVLIGHIFPIFFQFRGGKGVMTSLGVMLALDPIVFIIVVIICVPLIFITRIVSVASISGAVIYPLMTFIVRKIQHRPAVYDTAFAGIIGVIVLFVHRENIKRLLKGTENKFERKPKQK